MTGRPIVCVGTFAEIGCFRVASLALDGYGERARATSMLGNDAFIASQLLHASGEPVQCLLIKPTRSDVRVARDFVPGLRIQALGQRSGTLTKSAVLQAPDGQRYWLLPPASGGTLPPPPPSALGKDVLLYVDMYDELETALIAWLMRALTPIPTAGRAGALQTDHGIGRLVANLSASRQSEKATRLAPFSPLLVQASFPHALSSAALAEEARRLRAMACATYALVTGGAHGFSLAGPDDEEWTRHPTRTFGGAALGAGAAVSAGLLYGLAQDVRGSELADMAGKWVATYLQGES